MTDVDVIIVGAGPAGMSAALLLGRALRKVLLFDDGRPRNATASELHCYLTRDGIAPADFRHIGHKEILRFGVRVNECTVTDITPIDGGFRVATGDGQVHSTRKVLLATGVTDELPPVQGAQQMYGRSVLHCPYCDGYERRGQSWAAYGRGRRAAALAFELRAWTHDVVLCTDGPHGLEAEWLDRLARHGIALHTERIARLEGRAGWLQRIVFGDGSAIARHALFFTTGGIQRSDLIGELGLRLNRHGTVQTGRFEETNVPGIYVAGDASRDVQLVVVAAAEGAKAAFAINQALIDEDLA